MEPIEHSSITHRIDPIVVCNPDECRPPDALRRHLNVPDDKTLAVVAHTGPKQEQEALYAIGEEDVHVVHFDLTDPDALFPLAEWLGGADVIMTGAGFNAYWESKWLGFYDRCFFTAFPRKIDDQAWRVRECTDYWPKENGADQLARWIVEGG
jgi:NAD(P)-dependent dehydrogenase (short-subunit alcohol dehydrogenase family)